MLDLQYKFVNLRALVGREGFRVNRELSTVAELNGRRATVDSPLFTRKPSLPTRAPQVDEFVPQIQHANLRSVINPSEA